MSDGVGGEVLHKKCCIRMVRGFSRIERIDADQERTSASAKIRVLFVADERRSAVD